MPVGLDKDGTIHESISVVPARTVFPRGPGATCRYRWEHWAIDAESARTILRAIPFGRGAPQMSQTLPVAKTNSLSPHSNWPDPNASFD